MNKNELTILAVNIQKVFRPEASGGEKHKTYQEETEAIIECLKKDYKIRKEDDIRKANR